MTEQPPGPPKKLWASYIPDRKPQWKYHTNVGQAKSAIGIRISDSGYGFRTKNNIMQIHKANDSGDWDLVWEIPYGIKKEDLPWLNTEEEKSKREKAEREAIIRNLDYHFHSKRDANALEQIWKLDPKKPLDEQATGVVLSKLKEFEAKPRRY